MELVIVIIVALIILANLFMVRVMENKHFKVRLSYNFNLIRFMVGIKKSHKIYDIKTS